MSDRLVGIKCGEVDGGCVVQVVGHGGD